MVLTPAVGNILLTALLLLLLSSRSSCQEVRVASGAELLQALVQNDSWETITILQDLDLADNIQQWRDIAPPVVWTRNFTLRGASDQLGYLPIVNFRFVAGIIRLAPGVTLRLEQFIGKRMQQDITLQLDPGWDLVAPSPNSVVVMQSMARELYACRCQTSRDLSRLGNTSHSPAPPSPLRPPPPPRSNSVLGADSCRPGSPALCWSCSCSARVKQLITTSSFGPRPQPSFFATLSNVTVLCARNMPTACTSALETMGCARNTTFAAIAAEDEEDGFVELGPPPPLAPTQPPTLLTAYIDPPSPAPPLPPPPLAVGASRQAVTIGIAVGSAVGASLLLLGLLLAAWRGWRSKRASAQLCGHRSDDDLKDLMPHGHLGTAPYQQASLLNSASMHTTGTSNTTSSYSSEAFAKAVLQQTSHQGGQGYLAAITSKTPMRPELSVNISFERDLVMGHCIGKGAAGTVHIAVYQGQQVAVKMFNQQNLSDGDLRTFQQEVLVLSRTNHPSVVGLYGASLQLPNLCLVEELCDTCLEKFIYTGEEAASSKVTTTVLLSLAYDITCGLAYLHPSILHRDLKPANVLIKFDPGKGGLPRAKISDFGLARVRAAATLHTQALEVGTVAYMAPECFNLDQTGITHKCDIFSLGMVLWELAHWERPWKNLPSAAIIYNAAIAGKRPEFTASEGLCPPRLRKLIEACWAAEPLVRPAAADLAKEICLLAEELDITLPGMHAANA